MERILRSGIWLLVVAIPLIAFSSCEPPAPPVPTPVEAAKTPPVPPPKGADSSRTVEDN